MEQQSTAPPEVRNVVKFLRSSSSGVKTRVGVLNGKRVDYFKGKGAVKALLSPAYAKLKNVPKVTSDAEASQLLQSIIPYAFFLLVDRGNASGGANSPKHIQIVHQQQFKPDGYFAWFYEGSQLITYLGGALMVAVMLAGVMFPLWPPIMRLGTWYLSIGVLGLIGIFFGIAIVRLVIYIVTIIATPPGVWIFPKLFADVGFVESFIPLYEWDYPKKKSKKEKGKEKEKEKSEGGKSKKSKSSEVNGGTLPTLPPSQSQTRGAYIEEVPDE